MNADLVAKAMAEVAAAEVMPRFRRLAKSDIRQKEGNETVTVADEAAEAALTTRLLDILPGSVVVGEESCAADPAILERLTKEAPVWVIDPIDGTRNFAAGKADFAVMVALVRGNETVAGWIHHPIKLHTYFAEKGAGAFRDGKRLTPRRPQRDTELKGTISFMFFDEAPREALRERAQSALLPRDARSCAARQYMDIAEGRQHFALFRNMKPWDHLPGSLLVNEAGGRVAKWDGSPYRATDNSGGILAATTPDAWQQIREFLAAPIAQG